MLAPSLDKVLNFLSGAGHKTPKVAHITHPSVKNCRSAPVWQFYVFSTVETSNQLASPNIKFTSSIHRLFYFYPEPGISSLWLTESSNSHCLDEHLSITVDMQVLTHCLPK
jgi:hypothetical protein